MLSRSAAKPKKAIGAVQGGAELTQYAHMRDPFALPSSPKRGRPKGRDVTMTEIERTVRELYASDSSRPPTAEKVAERLHKTVRTIGRVVGDRHSVSYKVWVRQLLE